MRYNTGKLARSQAAVIRNHYGYFQVNISCGIMCTKARAEAAAVRIPLCAFWGMPDPDPRSLRLFFYTTPTAGH